MFLSSFPLHVSAAIPFATSSKGCSSAGAPGTSLAQSSSPYPAAVCHHLSSPTRLYPPCLPCFLDQSLALRSQSGKPWDTGPQVPPSWGPPWGTACHQWEGGLVSALLWQPCPLPTSLTMSPRGLSSPGRPQGQKDSLAPGHRPQASPRPKVPVRAKFLGLTSAMHCFPSPLRRHPNSCFSSGADGFYI